MPDKPSEFHSKINFALRSVPPIFGQLRFLLFMNKPSAQTKGLFSWALYDWANSAYFVMIQTFVFASFFAQSIAENETIGTALWGNMIGLAGIAIAILAPVLGAIADEGGRRKPWVLFFTVICVVGCLSLIHI